MNMRITRIMVSVSLLLVSTGQLFGLSLTRAGFNVKNQTKNTIRVHADKGVKPWVVLEPGKSHFLSTKGRGYRSAYWMVGDICYKTEKSYAKPYRLTIKNDGKKYDIDRYKNVVSKICPFIENKAGIEISVGIEGKEGWGQLPAGESLLLLTEESASFKGYIYWRVINTLYRTEKKCVNLTRIVVKNTGSKYEESVFNRSKQIVTNKETSQLIHIKDLPEDLRKEEKKRVIRRDERLAELEKRPDVKKIREKEKGAIATIKRREQELERKKKLEEYKKLEKKKKLERKKKLEVYKKEIKKKQEEVKQLFDKIKKKDLNGFIKLVKKIGVYNKHESYGNKYTLEYALELPSLDIAIWLLEHVKKIPNLGIRKMRNEFLSKLVEQEETLKEEDLKKRLHVLALCNLNLFFDNKTKYYKITKKMFEYLYPQLKKERNKELVSDYLVLVGEKLIEKGEKKDLKDKFNQKQCTICLEEFTDKDKELIKLPCGHIFHEKCLMKWFKTKKKNECPVCKRIAPTKISRRVTRPVKVKLPEKIKKVSLPKAVGICDVCGLQIRDKNDEIKPKEPKGCKHRLHKKCFELFAKKKGACPKCESKIIGKCSECGKLIKASEEAVRPRGCKHIFCKKCKKRLDIKKGDRCPACVQMRQMGF